MLSHRLREGWGRWAGLRHSFAKVSDPYALLGVLKTTPSPEIKKAYLKLATQFHPDMQSGSVDSFLLIKQAYEMIKADRGEINLQNLKPEASKPSNRPDPSRFTAEETEGVKVDRDYRVFTEKAKHKHKEEYLRFNSSFKTVTDIQEIRIRVSDVEIKDPTERFGLHLHTVQSPRLNPKSRTAIPVFILVIVFTLYILSASDRGHEQRLRMEMADNVGRVFDRSTVDSERMQGQELKVKAILADPNLSAALLKKQRLDPRIKNLISDTYINAQSHQA